MGYEYVNEDESVLSLRRMLSSGAGGGVAGVVPDTHCLVRPRRGAGQLVEAIGSIGVFSTSTSEGKGDYGASATGGAYRKLRRLARHPIP